MKKLFMLVAVGVIIFSFSACGGETKRVQIDIGDSKIYSKEEIQAAKDCVVKKFKTFEGCSLTKLWYDESKSGGKENEILLLSNFTVDANGGDGSFEPNSTQTYWSWMLTRDNENDQWKLVNWGY